MSESNIEHGLVEKSTGRKIVSPLDFKLDHNRPVKELPEYTDEWLPAYIKFLDQNISFCTRQRDRFPNDKQDMWNAQIHAYQYSRERLTTADFI